MPEDRATRRFIYALFAVIGVLSGLLIALFVRCRQLSSFLPLAEMAKTIETNYFYYDETDGEAGLIDGSLRGMVASIDDPYAFYYTQEEYDALQASHSGEYEGIGISISVPDASGARIDKVYAGSPMDEAGARAGDVIVRVNGFATANLQLSDVIALFHTDKTLPDALELSRDGTLFSITVQQATVHVPYVQYEMLEGCVGYLRIDAFLGNVVSETEAAIETLQNFGMTKLVLDLRDDPGGGLNEVLGISELFLRKGDLIVSIRSRTQKEQTYYSTKDGDTFPVVVLVNGNSASASELLTGALKDNGRAQIVGTQTFGKGIVQSYFRLSANAGWLKITTDAYFTPSGECIHGTGIKPDVACEQAEEYNGANLDDIPHEADVQLQRAVDCLQQNG